MFIKYLNPWLGYKNLYFRGEYWIAPSKYKNLTNHSIYSVPKFHTISIFRSTLDNKNQMEIEK